MDTTFDFELFLKNGVNTKTASVDEIINYLKTLETIRDGLLEAVIKGTDVEEGKKYGDLANRLTVFINNALENLPK